MALPYVVALALALASAASDAGDAAAVPLLEPAAVLPGSVRRARRVALLDAPAQASAAGYGGVAHVDVELAVQAAARAAPLAEASALSPVEQRERLRAALRDKDRAQLEDVAAFAEQRVRRAERWREDGASAPLAPLTSVDVEGGAAAIVARDAVHSEDGGLTGASIKMQRRVAEVGLGDTEEDVVETPHFGRTFWVTMLARRGGSDGGAISTERHRLVVSLGIPHGEPSLYSHVWAAEAGDADTTAAAADSSSSAAGPAPASARLRALSYNTWNSNPPKWLWHDARDRFRQYALRLFRLGDVVRAVAPHVVAFQEVRYDSSLGGLDAGWDGGRGALRAGDADRDADAARPSEAAAAEVGIGAAAEAACVVPIFDRGGAYDFRAAWALSALWFNRTCQFAEGDKYRQRNVARWADATTAAAWPDYGSTHPDEGDGGVAAAAARVSRARAAADEAAAAAEAAAARLSQASLALTAARVRSISADAVAAVASVGADGASVIDEAAGTASAAAAIALAAAKAEMAAASSASEAAAAAALAAAAAAAAAAAVPLPAPLPDASAGAIGCSPFSTHPPRRGPPSLCRLQRALLRSPHAQVEHLSAHLPGFQFVFAPGQMYLDRSQWLAGRHRDEEGPAIFSRLPILAADALLLSRNASDDSDGHQRLCLHALIDASSFVEGAGEGESGAGAGAAAQQRAPRLLVDVYTVHLALSEAARDRTVAELLAFVARSARGRLVLLAGDMNAEPHEPAMARLQRSVRAAHATATGGSGDYDDDGDGGALEPESVALRDVWLGSRHAPREPAPRDPDAAARRWAFTFPADDPVKRIDLVFAGLRGADAADEPLCSDSRGSSSGSGGGGRCVEVEEAYVVGQDATPGTELGGGGMVSAQSAIFASDHRGLAVHLRVPA